MGDTPVIKFGGTSLQGKDKFGPHEDRLLAECKAMDRVNDIYRLLASRRNNARAHRLAEVARDAQSMEVRLAAVERIGSHRVTFGTDGPHEEPDTVGFARRELEKVRSLGLRPEDERNVMGGTIARLLGLSDG